jgi:hypothetical protein
MRTSSAKRRANESGSARSGWLLTLAVFLLIATIAVLEVWTTVPEWLLPARKLTVGALHWAKRNWLSTAALGVVAAICGVLAPFIIRWLDQRRLRSTAGQERNAQQRAIMLQRVHYKWIAGVLEPSLARAAHLVLGLEPRPDLLDLA